MRTLFKRWWLWVITILAAAGIGVSVLFVYGGNSRVTQANFDKITVGMTLAQVREILGEEPAGTKVIHLLSSGKTALVGLTWHSFSPWCKTRFLLLPQPGNDSSTFSRNACLSP